MVDTRKLRRSTTAALGERGYVFASALEVTARVHDVNVKRIYEPPADADGTRVLVDRIWPRGLTKQRAAVNVWLKEIAPSSGLRKWFGHEPSRWKEFEARYRAELDNNGAAVDSLRELIHKGPVTLLYGAHDEAHNNAVALRGYLDSKREG